MEDGLQRTSAIPRDLTFHFLEHITNNFSDDQIVGRGGYGVVYKGVLDNGEEIVVKKLYNTHPGLDNDKQFKNECTNLMRLQHDNIVRLVGYCYEIAHKVVKHNGKYVCAEVENKALCFEYLHGGSLDKHLSDESCGLGWHTRYKIIKGICMGLYYLHKGFKDPIYHLDLKPANILLDKNMVPKIGDFGLSRLFDTNTTCTTKGIIGTPGYMPPEYINRCQITSKFDVFSLGVIIIQVMTGRDGYLKFGKMPPQDFIELVHENWGKRFLVTISSLTSYEIKTCLKIALRCVEVDRVKRPTITDIVDELIKLETEKMSFMDQEFENAVEGGLQLTSAIPRDLTFHFLERITNKFSNDQIVGHGGYGVVYKGVLDNGEEIVVKKLYNTHPGLDNEEQFKNECTNLMMLQHDNIVRLLGYCYEIAHDEYVNHKGKYVLAEVVKKALCFEYLHGGSLDRHLSGESYGLGWHTRYKIIKGICKGLYYLHKGFKYPIYHLDLKPANILLDKNMVPKIGDFGLSRLFDSTTTSIAKGIIGTPGYMPPEYVNRFEITSKFDVFSLGVTMIQVMTGREGYLKFGNMPPQDFIELVHENWGKRCQATMSSLTSQEIKTCLKIALRCVEIDRVKRPTITDIVDELDKLDTEKRSPMDQVDIQPEEAFNQHMSSGASDAVSALTASSNFPFILRMEYEDEGTGTKEKEHKTPEELQATYEGSDSLLWWRDLAHCQDGDLSLALSLAVVQANKELEDHCCVESGLPIGTVIGVFDGHGGPEAAHFACNNLLPNLIEGASGLEGMTVDAIRKAFLATDQGFIALVSRQWQLKPVLAGVGSCCLVGIVHLKTLFIANLGDSRAVLGKVTPDGNIAAEQLSREHNVANEDVRQELRAEHPDDPHIVVLKHNVWRVKGIIQVSRSIGDAYLKYPEFNREPLHSKLRLKEPFSRPLLSANPSVTSHSLQPSDRFVIFASDGFWEHVSNQQAVEIVQDHQRAEGSARRLIKAALEEAARKRELPLKDLSKIERGVRRHFHDDITVIVLFVNRTLEPLSIRHP